MKKPAIFVLLFALAVPLAAQQPAPNAAFQTRKNAPAAAQAVPQAIDDESIGRVRREMFDLMRSNPRVVEILRRDPSLLGDQAFIERNNPQLAQFLGQHPEVMRNPEFYLFSRAGGVGTDEAPWTTETERERVTMRLLNEVGPFFVLLAFLSAGFVLLRVLLENLRWKRTFKVQTDLHNKMLDKFSSNEELLAYVRSDAGKRFLESAILPINAEGPSRSGMSIARILIPLQVGVVLTLVGFGFQNLRSEFHDYGVVTVLGTLTLSLGIGFIISALLAWGIAIYMGLIPKRQEPEQNGKGASISAL